MLHQDSALKARHKYEHIALHQNYDNIIALTQEGDAEALKMMRTFLIELPQLSDEVVKYVSGSMNYKNRCRCKDCSGSQPRDAENFFSELGVALDSLGYSCREKGDYNDAAILFDRAIELNNALAMHNRACMYMHGDGGEVNYVNAIYLYDRAIKLIDAYSMLHRAYMYQHGKGGSVNYVDATLLYLDAFQQKGQLSDQLCQSIKKNLLRIIKTGFTELSINLSKEKIDELLKVTEPSGEIIYELFNNDFVSDDKICCFTGRQNVVYQYMRSFSEDDCYESFKNSLDPSHPLGKFFQLPETLFDRACQYFRLPATGFNGFFARSTNSSKEGTTLFLIAEQFKIMEEKRKPIANPILLLLKSGKAPTQSPVLFAPAPDVTPQPFRASDALVPAFNKTLS